MYTAAGKGVKHYRKGGALTSERRPTTRGLHGDHTSEEGV